MLQKPIFVITGPDFGKEPFDERNPSHTNWMRIYKPVLENKICELMSEKRFVKHECKHGTTYTETYIARFLPHGTVIKIITPDGKTREDTEIEMPFEWLRVLKRKGSEGGFNLFEAGGVRYILNEMFVGMPKTD